MPPSGPAAPTAAAVPEQLSLFEFGDVVPPRVPRLRGLRNLLAALDSQRPGMDAVPVPESARVPARRKPAAPPPRAASLWPDSFFD